MKSSAHRNIFKETLNNSARARRCLCGISGRGFGERDLVIPNKRVETRRMARKGASPMGFAGKGASRVLRHSAVATATVTRVATHDLRLFRLKRAPCRVIQRFLKRGWLGIQRIEQPPSTLAVFRYRTVSRAGNACLVHLHLIETKDDN